MRVAIAAFTDTGELLGKQIARGLSAAGHEIALQERVKGGLSEWTRRAFLLDAVVFVGACGIAVRAIAPYVRDKFSDPAVVSVDELGRFAVPLLSGHVGGANPLAREIAGLTGGTAVISTATDLHGRFAVDVWAAGHGLVVFERERAKAVSMSLLEGKKVGFLSDFPVSGRLPEGLTDQKAELGVHVTLDVRKNPFAQTLHLIPRTVTLGVGCRKGVDAQVFERVVCAALEAQGIPLCAVERVASIRQKQEEGCILAFCEKYHLPFCCFDAKELQAVDGVFHRSAFVEQTVGVDNVCERAAAKFGTLLLPKQSRDGVTVAASCRAPELDF